MRVALFCQSIVSDWNHGNAHFLRGVACELLARGHEVRIFEPRDSWSLQNLIADYGETPVASIGDHRQRCGRYRLLFHDTHHRSVTDRAGMRDNDLSGYDGVLAFGDIVRDFYEREGWARRAWTWHEAADVRVFHPAGQASPPATSSDLIWIGNWGDEERTRELECFLVNPVRSLHLMARVYGVRYPATAQEAMRAELSRHGREEILARHTSAHRLDELFEIYECLKG